jgi:hypothetical protein
MRTSLYWPATMNRAPLRWPATSLKKASCLAGDEEDAHSALAGGLPAAPPLRGPVAPTLRVVAPTLRVQRNAHRGASALLFRLTRVLAIQLETIAARVESLLLLGVPIWLESAQTT